MPAIAARLKLLRRKLKRNQSEMAELLGISFSLYSKLETARVPLSDNLAERIQARFALPENWLRSGEGELPESLLVIDNKAKPSKLISAEQVESVLELAQNPEYRQLAKETAETLQVSFARALAIIIEGKLKQEQTT
ncbi:MAG: helix-turn-helix transcriptional regulator [Oligosphaeraceae bacterium]|nr:helix-turn-helix transcriptional regulator [Oligosphaeraceae bacterium]